MRRCSTPWPGSRQSLHKWATDLRLLAHRQEIDEPFEAEQVGSSAMAYKRNPMRAERMCGLARFLMGLPAMAADTAATQWFERTLDDSAARRLYMPQAFLAADAVLRLALNIAGRPGGEPRRHRPAGGGELPYMATENLIMAAVAGGGDRQESTRRSGSTLRQRRRKYKSGGKDTLVARLQADPAFDGVNVSASLDPTRQTGRARLSKLMSS